MSDTGSASGTRGRWAAVAALVTAVVGVGVLWLVPTTAAGSDGSSASLFSLVGQWGLESIDLDLTVASVLLIVLTSVAVAVGGSAHIFVVRVVCAVGLVGMALFLAVGLDRALVSNTVLAVVFGVPAVLVVVSAVLSRLPAAHRRGLAFAR